MTVLPVSMAKVIIVNENDEIIGYKERGTEQPTDIFRSTSLWITNSKDEVLLARRAWTKRGSPGKWGSSAGGIVEEHETYDTNVLKETEEEIGLKKIKPTKGPKLRLSSDHNSFSQFYFLMRDLPVHEFKLQASEVAEVRWFTKEELKKAFQQDPQQFTSSIKSYVEDILHTKTQ